mgnify:FL=1
MFIKIDHENGYLYLDLEFVNQINCNIKEEMVEIIYKNQQQIMKYKPTNFTKTIEELDKCSIVVNRYYTEFQYE